MWVFRERKWSDGHASDSLLLLAANLNQINVVFHWSRKKLNRTFSNGKETDEKKKYPRLRNVAFESCPLSTSIHCRWHRHRFTDFKHVTQIETKLVDQLHNRSQWDFFPITRKANRRHWIWLRKLATIFFYSR